MSALWCPATGPTGGDRRLAAGWVRFGHLRDLRSGVHRSVEEMPAAELRPLISQRADILGLAMDRPRIMGILNVTPDSFSDGGETAARDTAVARAVAMVAEGADILDIGGESTRPGAATVAEVEEAARIVPVIAALRDAGITTPISVDTRKAGVARAALAAGADMVNDVSALTYDPEMADVVATARVPVCLMHAGGPPETMQDAPRYGDVSADVFDALAASVDRAVAAGIARDCIVVDPGIGFGKTLDHNLTLLRDVAAFHALGLPVLIGASRKRFIGTITGVETAGARVAGSVAVALHVALRGVQILRVHDIAATRQAVAMAMALADGDGT